jgi:hypothetical protein
MIIVRKVFPQNNTSRVAWRMDSDQSQAPSVPSARVWAGVRDDGERSQRRAPTDGCGAESARAGVESYAIVNVQDGQTAEAVVTPAGERTAQTTAAIV